ncbi:hypothetical protein ACFPZ0_14510 [Streptomonospora nanhaiensis]
MDLGEVKAGIRELREQQQDILDRLGEQDARHERTSDRLRALTETVSALDAAGGGGAGSGEDQEDGRPLDWVQVPADARLAWVRERAEWVRDVLMGNWGDLAQNRLRPCWPLHITLVNDMSLLEWLYEEGYRQRRLLSATDFRRTVEVLLDSAERITRTCPQPGSGVLHPVPETPRDDTAQVDRLGRDLDLARAYALYRQAQTLVAVLRDGEATEEERARARAQYNALGERLQAILHAAQVGKQEWEAFRAQASRQDEKRQHLYSAASSEQPKT